MSTPLLTIDNLRVHFTTEAGEVEAVRGIDLRIKQGEFIGIVGSPARANPSPPWPPWDCWSPTPDSSPERFPFQPDNGGRREAETKLRPSKMAMIFQYPMVSLSPVRRVGLQIMDAIKVLEPGFSERTYREKALDLLDEVNIDDPVARFKAYPFELSGGCANASSSPWPGPGAPLAARGRADHRAGRGHPGDHPRLLKEMQRKRSMSPCSSPMTSALPPATATASA